MVLHAKTGHGPHIPIFCIVIYVPFSVFCVLFVYKCVLDYCHRDIGALFDYAN
jgi:hypothetical protein